VSESPATVKNVWNVYQGLGLHEMPFESARYLLHRALELQTLEGCQFPRPLVEIGAGDGRISGLFFAAPIDYGLEIARYQPRFYEIYRQMLYVDGQRNWLPFASGAIGSIYSLSVLEHVKDPDALLEECSRVLMGGGLFVANIVTERGKHPPTCFTEDFCPSLLTPVEWQRRLATAGLVTRKAVPALPAWIVERGNAMAKSPLLRLPGLRGPLLRRFWNQMYRRGSRPTEAETALTVTLFCEKG